MDATKVAKHQLVQQLPDGSEYLFWSPANVVGLEGDGLDEQ